jgi:hypothetical protein
LKDSACEKGDREAEMTRGGANQSPSMGTRQYPEKYYLVLKYPGSGIHVLGGRHADRVDENTLQIVFDRINSEDEFSKFSEEIEETVEGEEKKRKLKSDPTQ